MTKRVWSCLDSSDFRLQTLSAVYLRIRSLYLLLFSSHRIRPGYSFPLRILTLWLVLICCRPPWTQVRSYVQNTTEHVTVRKYSLVPSNKLTRNPSPRAVPDGIRLTPAGHTAYSERHSFRKHQPWVNCAHLFWRSIRLYRRMMLVKMEKRKVIKHGENGGNKENTHAGKGENKRK